MPLERRNDAVSKAIQAQHNGVDQGQHHHGQLCIGSYVGDKPYGGRGNRGIAAVGEIRERNKRRQNASTQHDYRRILRFLGDLRILSPYLTKSEVRLRVAKAERKTDKHSPRPILETWECAGFRYQSTTFPPAEQSAFATGSYQGMTLVMP